MKKSKKVASGLLSLFIIAGVSVDTSSISMPNLLVHETYFCEDEKSRVRADATNKKKNAVKQKPMKYNNDVNNGKNYRDYFKTYYFKTGTKPIVNENKTSFKYVDRNMGPKERNVIRKNRDKIS